MGRKLLLCVDASAVTAGIWRAGRLRWLESFTNDASGHDALRDAITRHGPLPAFITVNSFEEEYGVHALPRLAAADRRAFLERKLVGLYRDCTYRGAAVLPRCDKRTRENDVLVAALTGVRVLGPWMKTLNAAGTSIAGVYPLALVLLQLPQQRALRNDRQLLVVPHEDSVRFLFLECGGLRLHRLTPGSRLDGAGLLSEIERTRAYLCSAGLLAPGEILDCAIFGVHRTEQALPPIPQVRLSCIDPAAAARALGCSRSDTEAIALALLGRRQPALNLAPPAATHAYRTGRSCRRLYLAAGAALSTGAMAVALGGHMVHVLEADQRASQAQLARQSEALMLAYPPGLGQTISRQQAIVRGADHVRARSRSPHAAYRAAATVLERHPAVVLERMDWRSEHPQAPSGDDLSTPEVLILKLALFPDKAASHGPGAVNDLLADLERMERAARVTLVRSSRDPVRSAEDGGIATGASRYEMEVLVGRNP